MFALFIYYFIILGNKISTKTRRRRNAKERRRGKTKNYKGGS